MPFLTILLLSVVVPCLLNAQTGLSGFDLRIYRPPADGTGIFNLHGSETLPVARLKTGFVLEHGHGLLAAVNGTGQQIRVVNDMLTGTLGSALGLFPSVQTGLAIPVIFFEKGQNIQTGSPFTTASLGDLAFDFKLNILDRLKRPFGFSFLSQTTVPTGSQTKFTGYRTMTEEVKLIADKEIGRFRGVTNLGFRTLGRTQANIEMDEMLTFGGGVAYTPPVWGDSVELMAEVDGETVLRSASELSSPFEWVIGAKKKLPHQLSTHAGVARGITSGIGGGEWRLIAGVDWQPSDPLWNREPIFLGRIYFAFNKSKFLRKYYPPLDEIAERLKEKKGMKVKIRGHSDNEGTSDWNLSLSARRADHIKLYFIEQGVLAKQIEMEAVGEREPAADNRTREGKSKNRRVEIWEVR